MRNSACVGCVHSLNFHLEAPFSRYISFLNICSGKECYTNHGFVTQRNNLGFIALPVDTQHSSHVTMLVRKGESPNPAYTVLLVHTHSVHDGRGHTKKKGESHLVQYLTSMH